MRSFQFYLHTCAIAITLGSAPGTSALASSMKIVGIRSPSEPTSLQATPSKPEALAKISCAPVVTVDDNSSKQSFLVGQPAAQMMALAHEFQAADADLSLAMQPPKMQFDAGETDQANTHAEDSLHPAYCRAPGGPVDHNHLASAGTLLAPSVQYILPDEPYDWAHLHITPRPKAPLAGLRRFT